MSTLELRDVTLTLPDRRLLGPLSMSVVSGEVLSLLGPSGVGKSSLLAFVCGVLPRALTASGCVVLDGEDVTSLPPQRRRVGILFQDDLLFPHLSVGGNLAFGLRTIERSRRQRARLIDETLDAIGLAGFAARDPATMSGGQRARVALLRVLLSGPRALLLDEPFAHLDAQTRRQTREFVFEEVRRRQLPTLLVTHDPDDVHAAGGACVKLTAADGESTCSMHDSSR
ncbi:MAG: ATP-binding cassette domain-containing protein [Gammaproteobacteria bacterium]